MFQYIKRFNSLAIALLVYKLFELSILVLCLGEDYPNHFQIRHMPVVLALPTDFIILRQLSHLLLVMIIHSTAAKMTQLFFLHSTKELH